jgi:hypothetical protein
MFKALEAENVAPLIPVGLIKPVTYPSSISPPTAKIFK